MKLRIGLLLTLCLLDSGPLECMKPDQHSLHDTDKLKRAIWVQQHQQYIPQLRNKILQEEIRVSNRSVPWVYNKLTSILDTYPNNTTIDIHITGRDKKDYNNGVIKKTVIYDISQGIRFKENETTYLAIAEYHFVPEAESIVMDRKRILLQQRPANEVQIIDIDFTAGGNNSLEYRTLLHHFITHLNQQLKQQCSFVKTITLTQDCNTDNLNEVFFTQQFLEQVGFTHIYEEPTSKGFLNYELSINLAYSIKTVKRKIIKKFWRLLHCTTMLPDNTTPQ